MNACSDLKSIGKRIRDLREGRGLTQEELSKGLNIQREKLAKMETGRQDFKTQDIINVAVFFDVSCDYLLRGVSSEFIDIYEQTGFTEETINSIKSIKSPICKEILLAIICNLSQNFLETAANILESIYLSDAFDKRCLEDFSKKQNIKLPENYSEARIEDILDDIQDLAFDRYQHSMSKLFEQRENLFFDTEYLHYRYQSLYKDLGDSINVNAEFFKYCDEYINSIFDIHNSPLGQDEKETEFAKARLRFLVKSGSYISDSISRATLDMFIC